LEAVKGNFYLPELFANSMEDRTENISGQKMRLEEGQK